MIRVPVFFPTTVRAENNEFVFSVNHPAFSFANTEKCFQEIAFMKKITVFYNFSVLPGNGITPFENFQRTQILIPFFQDIQMMLHTDNCFLCNKSKFKLYLLKLCMLSGYKLSDQH